MAHLRWLVGAGALQAATLGDPLPAAPFAPSGRWHIALHAALANYRYPRASTIDQSDQAALISNEAC